jgi:anthranilate synthase component II
MILVIDNYDSFTWNLVHYLEEAGGRTKVVRNDEISVSEALAMKPDGVVLSPGPCTPNEAGICVELIRSAPETLPILGVCLGHQAIGQAFGGTVSRAGRIRHGKLSTVTHEGASVFDALPSPLTVTRYHSLAVMQEDLPAMLTATAHSEDGEIMGLMHESRPVHGVQFHPESIRTEAGKEMVRNFIRIVEGQS